VRNVISRELDDRLVAVIRAYQRRHGYPPSLREMAAAVGRSPSAVLWRLERLRGVRVDWVDGQPRTWQVIERRDEE